jgi:hypothetical protein
MRRWRAAAVTPMFLVFFKKRFHGCFYETICRWDHRSDLCRLLFHGLFDAG